MLVQGCEILGLAAGWEVQFPFLPFFHGRAGILHPAISMTNMYNDSQNPQYLVIAQSATKNESSCGNRGQSKDELQVILDYEGGSYHVYGEYWDDNCNSTTIAGADVPRSSTTWHLIQFTQVAASQIQASNQVTLSVDGSTHSANGSSDAKWLNGFRIGVVAQVHPSVWPKDIHLGDVRSGGSN